MCSFDRGNIEGTNSFDRGNIEGTNPSKICVSCLHMYVLFYVCVGIGLWTDL